MPFPAGTVRLELTADEFKLLCFVLKHEARNMMDASKATELEMLRTLADRINEQHPETQLILP